MTTRTAERIDSWESRPFSGGYAGLHELADASFSGVVRAGPATCCLLNGTVVGVLDGTIEDFEGTDGTARKAPSPALPLLMVMQEGDADVRTKYYSEDTALAEADSKLSDGGFTGFIELSENVLSGDYYVVYHGGRSMSVAFVGESAKLLTDDEAFERANDEVGIYKVYTADVETIDLPEPEDEADESDVAAGAVETTEGDETSADDAATEAAVTGAAAAVDGESTAGSDAEPEAGVAHREGEQSESETAHSSEEAVRDGPRSEPIADEESADSATAESEATDDDKPETPDSIESDRPAPADREPEETTQEPDRPPRETTGSERASQDVSERQSERDARDSREDHPVTETGAGESDRTGQTRHERRSERATEPTTGQAEQITQSQSVPDHERRETGSENDTDPLAAPQGENDASGASFGQSGELERRSIPSVDPDMTWTAGEDDPSEPARQPLEPRKITSGQSGVDQTSETERPAGGRTEVGPAGTREQSGPADRQSRAESSELVAELREKERTIESLEEQLADLESERDAAAAERDELRAELDAVREERDDLQSEVERLRSEVAELEAELESAEEGDGIDAQSQLSVGEAIDKTNLFVRYGSKGEATLKAAHKGDADREDVNANLDLEYHTQFDAAEVAVDGEPFDAFLTGTIQYRFVDWIVHDLLYEIRDTGHTGALRDLFDALPRLDRAELNGSVSITYTEDGEEHRTQEHFDVVLRDRMGNPLAVANINDSREAATGDMMSSLVTDATRVGESSDSLASAFLVTSSFFDPGALETASESTGGGLLSRDKRESFVRLSRKQGYHLCLVEARDEKFHLAVPEL